MDMYVPLATAQLGGRIADFRWSQRARGSRWLLVGLVLGLGVLLIALGFQAVPQAAPILLGTGLLLLPFGVAMAFFSFRQGTHPPPLTLYEQGLVMQRGRRVHLVRYEEIAAMWEQILWQAGRRNILPRRTHVYTLQTRDRTTLRLNDRFADIARAGALVQQEVLRRRLPEAAAAYQAGGAIPFGPLTVSRMGLARGKDVLPWAEVASVSIAEGHYRGTAVWTYKLRVMRMGKRRPWLELDIAQIPNSSVLLALLKEIGVTPDTMPVQ